LGSGSRLKSRRSAVAAVEAVRKIEEGMFMQSPDRNIDELLRTAIEQRRLIRLVYHHKERVVEPHDYGIQNGSPKLLAYQVAGSSSGKLPNWRWMETDLISDVHLLNRTFPGGRSTSSGKHHSWDKLFIRVRPAAN
jgi:hypothetical protein